MAHVILRSMGGHGHQLIVDGHDLSKQVLTDGFELFLNPICDGNGRHIADQMTLNVQIAVDELEVDVAGAVNVWAQPTKRKRWWHR